jgi:decaprenylphospho-beta-D-erythro-pentofuranosid-2-ulose 2-reductase
MENAVHEPQHVLVLGGTSDIGVAIARRVMSPNTTYVGLACRRPESAAGAVESLTRPGTVVEALEFDATRVEDHRDFVDRVVAEHGDLDVVVLAFGQLGDQERFDDDPTSAAAVVDVNYTSAVAIGLEIARRFRVQGHGTLVVLSSVAGERARKSNFVYGSSKAALDAFAQGLGDSLEGSGARVLVVRPGFVHSAMTAGLKPAPFATTPDAVADVVARGLRTGRRIVWAPGILRWVFMVLRHVPHPIWRRLPLG